MNLAISSEFDCDTLTYGDKFFQVGFLVAEGNLALEGLQELLVVVWVIRADEEERGLVVLLSLILGSAERLLLEDWLEHRLDPKLHVVYLACGIVVNERAVDEQLDGRIPTNTVLPAYTGLDCAVDLRKHYVLHLWVVRQSLELWSERLAVSAPRGVELDERRLGQIREIWFRKVYNSRKGRYSKHCFC